VAIFHGYALCVKEIKQMTRQDEAGVVDENLKNKYIRDVPNDTWIKFRQQALAEGLPVGKFLKRVIDFYLDSATSVE
jgi:hypothetical protein